MKAAELYDLSTIAGEAHRSTRALLEFAQHVGVKLYYARYANLERLGDQAAESVWSEARWSRHAVTAWPAGADDDAVWCNMGTATRRGFLVLPAFSVLESRKVDQHGRPGDTGTTLQSYLTHEVAHTLVGPHEPDCSVFERALAQSLGYSEAALRNLVAYSPDEPEDDDYSRMVDRGLVVRLSGGVTVLAPNWLATLKTRRRWEI